MAKITFISLLILIESVFATEGQRANPSCYITGTVYRGENPVSNLGPVDHNIRTLKIPLANSRAECRRTEIQYDVEGTPFVLHMRYRSFCHDSGASFEGYLTDNKYNLMSYSKYDPRRDESVNVVNRSYLISHGNTYSISLTCF